MKYGLLYIYASSTEKDKQVGTDTSTSCEFTVVHFSRASSIHHLGYPATLTILQPILDISAYIPKESPAQAQLGPSHLHVYPDRTNGLTYINPRPRRESGFSFLGQRSNHPFVSLNFRVTPALFLAAHRTSTKTLLFSDNARPSAPWWKRAPT